MLPLEICALVLLASASIAIPPLQGPRVPNSTITSIGHPETFKWTHQESTATELELGEPTTTQKGVVVTFTDQPIIIIEESATGFETEYGPRTTTPLRAPPEQTPQVVVTNTPTIIYIHTEIATTMTGLYPGNEFGPGSETTAAPQPSPDGHLLNDILSRIGRPHPGAQPSPQPASPSSDIVPNGNHESIPGNENTEGPLPIAPATIEVPGALPAPTVDEVITLGPETTLTLTNGLSTTVGAGSAGTFIALTTNTVGYTIIVISSSGTAVTATVSEAPVTITLPKTGFEASITAVARFGTPSADAATTTSSKGEAADRMTWDTWIGIVVGLVGSGAMLG
ncbi:hypothetical protein K505DRAFT_359632 [Melanomma pulvis-pyrius CBS 109.77]|uniref:Uncharacterized protein n=1 Tax=Melanomma pulvis-pyrius CBS 109.77 TaxID=1314802 RepID=A0A6A6XKK1_9PLEO|nr:hypothetical protein K505DRAFT_359632 [Melanomma pulvis-pyrius CBS 109.77]